MGVVCFRAWTPDQIPRSAMADPMQMPIRFRVIV